MKKETKKETIKEVKNNKKTVEKTVKKEKKTNIFAAIGKYFRGVAKEVNRIKWTSGKDLLKYSIAAVAFVIFFGIYFYGIDWIALIMRGLAAK